MCSEPLSAFYLLSLHSEEAAELLGFINRLSLQKAGTRRAVVINILLSFVVQRLDNTHIHTETDTTHI